MRIAWLGTGLMGDPMARRLLAAGHEVAVWNRTAERTAAAVAAGARAAGSPADAIAGAEVVFAMLRDGPVTAEVLLAREPAPDLAGRAVVQMATIAHGESRALAAAVAEHGGEYLEAPVLGSIGAVEAGQLLVFAGGEPALFERLRPLLAVFGPEPLLAGPVGQAATLKVAFNQMIAGISAAFCLSLGIVRRAGIDVDLFMRLLRQSAFHTKSFEGRLPRYLARDYEHPSFPLALLLKDVELGLGEAARLGLDASGLEGVRALAAAGVERGLARADYGALYEAVDPAGE
ncbi:MAG: NAD(P)-dependent oxidoreductase [Thermoanaerobaculia bacterium]|nr:NAD(P)-dependent oxidoreductase [Thermoanaerobaculia bacterium]MCZ7652865.1 NAD(P)-dependent oxidoreductase [Thermoanaerobaculia bacterium]